MKKIVLPWMALMMGISMSGFAIAGNDAMNTDLVQLVDQLDAMLPLIAQAEKAQDAKAPVQFHFETWTDNQGIRHNGLKQDVLAMRAAIVGQINAPAMTPRAVAPLEQDYVEKGTS